MLYSFSIDRLPWWAILLIIVIVLLIILVFPANFFLRKKGKEDKKQLDFSQSSVEETNFKIVNRASEFEQNKPKQKKEKLLLGMYNGVGHKTAIRSKSLVYVYPEHDSCELCRPFEGKIISLEKLDDQYVTMSEAISKGYHHLGCKHIDFDYYIKETEIPESPWSEKEQINFHKKVLGLFKLENGLRKIIYDLENGFSKNVEVDRIRVAEGKKEIFNYCEKNNLTYTDRRFTSNISEVEKYKYIPIEEE